MSENKLTHLSPREIDELMELYYSGEKASELVKVYDIAIQPARLVSLFPPIVHDNLKCPYCEHTSLVEARKARDNHSYSTPYCPKCKHKLKGNCQCDNCLALAEAERGQIESKKRRIIIENYSISDRACPEIEKLSLEDALYICSLYSHSTTEDMVYCDLFSNKEPELAPTFEYQLRIVRHLNSRHLIAASPNSRTDAFVFNEELSAAPQFYTTMVEWLYLPGVSRDEKTSFINELNILIRTDDWIGSWHEDLIKVWIDVAKYECIEYYKYLLAKRNFELDEIGPKTHNVFEYLLKNFSTGQVFNLTWQAVRDTTDYIVSRNVPHYRAKNTFIGAIQRKADKFLSEGWEVRNSRRDYNCPQSVVSSTFYDIFNPIGSKALETIIPIQRT